MDPYIKSNNPDNPSQFPSPYLTQKSPDLPPKKPSKSRLKKLFTFLIIILITYIGFEAYNQNIYWQIKSNFENGDLSNIIDNISNRNDPFTSASTTKDILPVINKEKSFSVIVMPDTQFYSESYPEIFCQQTDWIVANRNRLNIAMVSHMGDIVNDGGKQDQWDVAVSCLKTLDGKVVYGIVPGNHDTTAANNKTSGFENYNSHFPAKKFRNESWYVDNFSENQNSAIIIEKLGVKMLFINLEIEPSDNAIVWANNVIQKYPGIYTIVTTHKYLPDDSTTLDEKTAFSDPEPNNNGSQIWRKLVNNNCQIKMVWNGHYHNTDGENKITTLNSCGQPVEQILQDYQTREKGGNGLLRIYTFTPETKKIGVKTYSPTLGTFEKDSSSEFELDFAI